MNQNSASEQTVPDSVIPAESLPPLRVRDLPKPISWRRMIGPGIVLAGFSIGSGEFVLWPRLVHEYGFTIFWACLVGVTTQFFLNMEIERWALATGECAVAGFARLWKHWAWIFLACNCIVWLWPGWASGGAQLLSWLTGVSPRVAGISTLLVIGVALTLGPVVYKTLEGIQAVLVVLVILFVLVLVAKLASPASFKALAVGLTSFGYIPEGIEMPLLLGALAYAGAGGMGNLCQALYIRDKGYGMGRFIGRITSPITGQEEADSETGYHFAHTPENLRRWRAWWRAANIEHFLTFFLICALMLVLLAVLADSTIGHVADPGRQISFIRAESNVIANRFGPMFGTLFLIMGVAIFLSTELGVLDVASRLSAEIIKVNYARASTRWSKSKLYFIFLWGEIAIGCIILFFAPKQPLTLLVIGASLNGASMAVYSLILLYMNTKILGKKIGMGWVRFLTMVWACAFYGYFAAVTLAYSLPKLWR